MKKSTSVRASGLQISLALALIFIWAILLASSFAQLSGDRRASSAVEADVPIAVSQPDISFNFTTIDFPGATNTFAGGINSLGHIVGGYALPNGSRHGFVDVSGVFTTIDDPNATVGTEAADVNSSEQIVGSYDFTDPNHPLEGAHGFLLSGGVFTAIDYPAQGVTSTTPNGINGAGDVVGVYRMSSPGIAFLLSGGVYNSFVYPGGCCTHANGINDAGQIVGQYKTPDDTAPPQGFLKTGNTFTTIDYPGANVTSLAGINNFGDIVGQARTRTAPYLASFTAPAAFPQSFSQVPPALSSSALTIMASSLASIKIPTGYFTGLRRYPQGHRPPPPQQHRVRLRRLLQLLRQLRLPAERLIQPPQLHLLRHQRLQLQVHLPLHQHQLARRPVF
jgi:hypothetical protein